MQSGVGMMEGALEGHRERIQLRRGGEKAFIIRPILKSWFRRPNSVARFTSTERRAGGFCSDVLVLLRKKLYSSKGL